MKKEVQKQNQKDIRRHAEAIIQKTLADVLPDRAVQEALERLNLLGRVFVLAVGKAAWVMAETAGKWLEGREEVWLEKGLVVTKYGHGKGELPRFAMMESGHPVPDENSVKRGRRPSVLCRRQEKRIRSCFSYPAAVLRFWSCRRRGLPFRIFKK